MSSTISSLQILKHKCSHLEIIVDIDGRLDVGSFYQKAELTNQIVNLLFVACTRLQVGLSFGGFLLSPH